MSGVKKVFAGGVQSADLNATINASALSFTVGSGQGAAFPDGSGGTEFTVDFNLGSTSQERVLCESRSGDTFTVKAGGRGFDGTTAVGHSAGSGVVTHGLDADSANEFMVHVYETDHVGALSDGSASAPALAFASDTDTGLYRPAADKTAIAAGGKAVATFEGGAHHYLKLHAPAAGQDFILDWVDEGGDIWYRQYFDSSTSRFRMFAYNNGTSEGETYVSLTSGHGGVWRFPAGSATQPALSFVSDPDTGIYSHSSDTLAFALGGAERYLFYSGGTGFIPSDDGVRNLGSATNRWKLIHMANGTAAAPSYTFGDDTDTGIYRGGTGDLRFSLDGTMRMRLTASNSLIETNWWPNTDITYDLGAVTKRWNRIYMGDGSVGSPAYTFGGDTDTGIYRSGVDDMRLSAGGANIIGVQADRITAYKVLRETDGSAAAPAYSFFNDTDTGIYLSSADALTFAANAAAKFQVNASNNKTYQHFIPSADNTYDLGAATTGDFRDAYVTNGVTTGSDERLKDDIADSDLGLDFIRALRPISWRWKNGGSRPHYGLSAQQVKATLDDLGCDFAGFVDGAVAATKKGRPKKAKPEKVEQHDGESDDDYKARKQQAKDDADDAHTAAVAEWEEQTTGATFRLRYHEFIGPLVKAVQEQQTQIDAQQQTIDALTARLDAAGI